jgi:hypothetical protein
MRLRYAFAALALAASPTALFAGAVVSGFNGTAMDADDDFFVGPVNLGFSANYFGTTYSDTFVSNNGYVTFGAGSADYTPVGLGSGYSGPPIIAAFFADIDTRVGNTAAYGAGTFDGRTAFGATWNDVGYYARSTDKLNTLQLLLVDRSDTGAGNFDIVFNYDKIQWEAGNVESPTNDGLGGNTASVGYNAGVGGPASTYFEFAGSQTPGSFLDAGPQSLVANSNIGVAGRYLFNVRNGDVTPPPTSDVPEPATWAMFIGGFGLIGTALRRNRRVSVRFA